MTQIEETWDFLCSNLGILEDEEKQDIVRHYGDKRAFMVAESWADDRRKFKDAVRDLKKWTKGKTMKPQAKDELRFKLNRILEEL